MKVKNYLILFLLVSACAKSVDNKASGQLPKGQKLTDDQLVCQINWGPEWYNREAKCMEKVSHSEQNKLKNTLSQFRVSGYFYPEILSMSFVKSRYPFLDKAVIACLKEKICIDESLVTRN